MATNTPDTKKTASEVQSERDRSTIKIQLIENAILIGAGPDGWFSFPEWDGPHGASAHIRARLEALKDKRSNGPKGGC